jgi:hypothetical protein
MTTHACSVFGPALVPSRGAHGGQILPYNTILSRSSRVQVAKSIVEPNERFESIVAASPGGREFTKPVPARQFDTLVPGFKPHLQ